MIPKPPALPGVLLYSNNPRPTPCAIPPATPARAESIEVTSNHDRLPFCYCRFLPGQSEQGLSPKGHQSRPAQEFISGHIKNDKKNYRGFPDNTYDTVIVSTVIAKGVEALPLRDFLVERLRSNAERNIVIGS